MPYYRGLEGDLKKGKKRVKKGGFSITKNSFSITKTIVLVLQKHKISLKNVIEFEHKKRVVELQLYSP